MGAGKLQDPGLARVGFVSRFNIQYALKCSKQDVTLFVNINFNTFKLERWMSLVTGYL